MKELLVDNPLWDNLPFRAASSKVISSCSAQGCESRPSFRASHGVGSSLHCTCITKFPFTHSGSFPSLPSTPLPIPPLPFPFPFHRHWPQKHLLIHLLHVSLCLRVSFSRNTLCHTSIGFSSIWPLETCGSEYVACPSPHMHMSLPMDTLCANSLRSPLVAHWW